MTRAQLLALLRAGGIGDERVLAAMARVPRPRFVPKRLRAAAWENRPLPLRDGQTISQPFVVAMTAEATAPRGGNRMLEIGTGSGYQAAVLAELGVLVHSIEIRPELARIGRRNLDRAGYGRVRTRIDDGHRGWPEQAPFDAVILTAAPAEVPAALLEQVAPGGCLVGPVGVGRQELVRLRRGPRGWDREELGAVRFVPMVRAD